MATAWIKIELIGAALVASLIVAGTFGAGQAPSHKSGRATTINGYVMDSACTFKNHLKEPVSAECTEKSARAGSPLVIQADDGTIYLPISGEIPAAGQNDKLMKFAGQKVIVTGTTYARGGSRAIVIEKIEEEKGS
jgi:hypothetical protein